MRGMTVGLALCLALCLAVGCDSGGGGGGGGGGGPAGACEAVGDVIDLPAAIRFAVASHRDGYLVVGEEGFGSNTWATTVIGADGVTTRVEDLPGSDPVALAGGEMAWGFGPGGLFDPTSRIRVRPWDGQAWGDAPEDYTADVPDGVEGFNQASALALGADGTLAVAWSASRPTGDGAQVWVHVKRPGQPLGAAELAFEPAASVRNTAIHVGVAADGAVHLAATASGEVGVSLLHRARGADGAWGAVATVGPVPGALGNTTMTGLAVGAAGVFAAQAQSADFMTGDDGVTVVWALGSDGWAELGRVGDERAVVGGLALAALPDGAVAAVTYGQNNFEASQSEDTVELHRCGAGGCGRALTVAPGPGVFYGNVQVVTRGDAGLVVWHEEGKGDADFERNRAQRFRCAASE